MPSRLCACVFRTGSAQEKILIEAEVHKHCKKPAHHKNVNGSDTCPRHDIRKRWDPSNLKPRLYRETD